MTDEILIKQLREIEYPGQVDVTDAVMLQVRKTPIMAMSRRHTWRRVSVAAVASLALIFGINVALIYSRDYNVNQIGCSLAEVYDYHADYGLNVESEYSLGFIESLYE